MRGLVTDGCSLSACVREERVSAFVNVRYLSPGCRAAFLGNNKALME
jgi:hypothetical protein